MELSLDRSDLLFDLQYELHELFVRTMDGMLSSAGLTLLQFYVLKSLKDYGRMCKMSELAASRLLSPATATGIADRLVNLGFVRRVSDKSDRRIVLLTLTDRAVELLDSIEGQSLKLLGKFLDRVSAEDRATVRRVIVDFADFLKSELNLQKAN
jgi:DNA-binding MarR family transcriptional regulator